MKIKDFTKVGKQLLPELPGFVQEKNLIFRSPITDIFYGFCFGGSRFDPNCFYFSVLFLPLFVLRQDKGMPLTFGKDIRNALNWTKDNPRLLADLHAAVRDEGLPFLNSVLTLPEAIRYMKAKVEFDRPRVNSHILEALACTLIKSGDYPSALKALAEFKQLFRQPTYAWELKQGARINLIEEKLLEDPGAAVAQLDAWKAETARNLELEEFLEPSVKGD